MITYLSSNASSTTTLIISHTSFALLVCFVFVCHVSSTVLKSTLNLFLHIIIEIPVLQGADYFKSVIEKVLQSPSTFKQPYQSAANINIVHATLTLMKA